LRIEPDANLLDIDTKMTFTVAALVKVTDNAPEARPISVFGME
jgi:hypothetical protein